MDDNLDGGLNKKTIADHMKDILIENGYVSISYGDINEIEECAKRSEMYNKSKTSRGNHPLNIISKVLGALDRSELFEKRYLKGYKNRDIRCFFLKENLE